MELYSFDFHQLSCLNAFGDFNTVNEQMKMLF